MFAGNVSINYVTKHILTLDHYLDRESQVDTDLLNPYIIELFLFYIKLFQMAFMNKIFLNFLRGLSNV